MKVTVACTQMACSWDIEANIGMSLFSLVCFFVSGRRAAQS